MNEPDYTSPEFLDKARAKIAHMFETLPFFKLMGFELLEIEPGRSKLAMTWRPDLLQPAGIMHGGAIASLVDTAFAQAIILTKNNQESAARGGGMVTIDLRVKYFRPVSGGRIVCEAKVTRPGRQIVHVAGVVTNDEGKEVAQADSIYMLISPEQLKRKGS